jgi:hypothetical protein
MARTILSDQKYETRFITTAMAPKIQSAPGEMAPPIRISTALNAPSRAMVLNWFLNGQPPRMIRHSR